MDLEQLSEAYQARLERAAGRARLKDIYRKIGAAASDIRSVLEATAPDPVGLYDSLAAIRGLLVELLRVEGVEIYGQLGEPADPDRHEVASVRGPAADTCTVLAVEREGLLWEGDVLQKAVVVVSETKGPQRKD
jgi:molecular chaperone GrpE (heat shock protein)